MNASLAAVGHSNGDEMRKYDVLNQKCSICISFMSFLNGGTFNFSWSHFCWHMVG